MLSTVQLLVRSASRTAGRPSSNRRSLTRLTRRAPSSRQKPASSCSEAPGKHTVCTDSLSCMSVSPLYFQAEALPIGFELCVQRLDVRTDHVRRIAELAIPVSLVVLQIVAH